MRKILAMIMLALAPLCFSACDDDDDYYYGHGWQGGGAPSGELNQYERDLVGSYVSDNDPSNPFYLVLNSDRSGSYSYVSDGTTKGEDFTWGATSNTLTVVYRSDGYRDEMGYYYADGHLYVDGIPLVVNTGQVPGDSDNPLVGQWEGKINGFYAAMYGLAEDSCATVCEFAANGEGTQLDYNTYKPKTDYAYSPFTWTQADGVIVVTYVDNALPRAVFTDYALSSTRFSGSVLYDKQLFGFAYTATSGFDWSPYITGSGVAAAKTRLSELRRAKSGPVRSGGFAR